MNWVKNRAAMAGAIWVIACIVAPTRPRAPCFRSVCTTGPDEAPSFGAVGAGSDIAPPFLPCSFADVRDAVDLDHHAGHLVKVAAHRGPARIWLLEARLVDLVV